MRVWGGLTNAVVFFEGQRIVRVGASRYELGQDGSSGYAKYDYTSTSQGQYFKQSKPY